MDNFTGYGYRNDAIYNSGFNKIEEVLKHEIFVLGNYDIIKTLKDKLKDDCCNFIKNLGKNVDSYPGFSALSKSLDDIENLYYKSYSKDDPDFNNIIDYQVNILCNHINLYFNKEIKYVLWLCDSVDDVLKNYCDKPEDIYNIGVYYKGDIILSQLQSGQGSLYGYEEVPENIKEKKEDWKKYCIFKKQESSSFYGLT